MLRHKDSLSADAIKPLGSQGFVQPASSPTILSGGPQEGSLRVSKRFCCLSLGVRIHRSVLQIASGKFMSILVIHVASLASSLPFERILVLREDGFTDSNHGQTSSSAYGIDRDTGLLARLVAPHVSSTGNMSRKTH